jgi:hypothetical protein
LAALQQFANANPGLAVVAAFSIGVLFVLAVRILLSSAGCLIRLAVTVGLIIGILLLLRFVSLR